MSITLTPPAGPILRPGDPGWDDARQACNLATDQKPAAVAFPRSAADVAAAVSLARQYGLRLTDPVARTRRRPRHTGAHRLGDGVIPQ